MTESSVCLDANLVVRLLLPGPKRAEVRALWRAWDDAGVRFTAPDLIGYEVVNAMHRYERAGMLSDIDAAEAVLRASQLPIELHPGSRLHSHARRLAQIYGLSAAYDAHYLALAEQLGCKLYTQDTRLARAVGDFPWIQLV